MRIGDDVLAPPARLAASRLLGAAAPRTLEPLGDADQINWERACLDSASVPANKGARRPARIQRIAPNRARIAILWSTAAVPRSPSA